MKKLLPLLLITTIALTGCISRRDADTLTAENSAVITEPGGAFSLQAPNGYQLLQGTTQPASRLISLTDKKGEQSYMDIEETDVTVNDIVSQIESVADVEVLSNEEIEINGLIGRRVATRTNQGTITDIEFTALTGGDKTYLITRNLTFDWVLFDQVLNTFTLIQ